MKSLLDTLESHLDNNIVKMKSSKVPLLLCEEL